MPRFDMQQKLIMAEIKAIASDVLQHCPEILFAYIITLVYFCNNLPSQVVLIIC